MNNKDVRWEIKNNFIANDRPIEFKKAMLIKSGKNSYDMLVRCIYKTKENRKLILSPIASFHWYVDGLAEKALGRDWYKTSQGNLACTRSPKNCGFIFR